MIFNWNFKQGYNRFDTYNGSQVSSIVSAAGTLSPTFVANPLTVFSIQLFDQFGNLSKELSQDTNVQWEWNRTGGCGQAIVTINEPYDKYGTNIQNSVKPKSSVKIYIGNQLRYQGEVIKVSQTAKTGSEQIILTCYGYVIELSSLIINQTFEGQEISAIIKSILDSTVVPNSDITYSASDIQQTDYAVQSIALQHTVKDAFTLLAGLAGDVEWGVDQNRKFFFKQTDPNVRRVYVVGREVTQYQEDRSDENVFNAINVFGVDGTTPLATLSAQLSGDRYGTKQFNLFESSISEPSDANRLGSVTLLNLASSQRSIKVTLGKADEFIEATTPLGATAINRNIFSSTKKYGHHIKYGAKNQYGNIKRDQITNIQYATIGGGLSIILTLQGDLPNIGDRQKRTEYEIRDLQRR